MIPAYHALILSGILFCIGIVGVIARRNLLFVLMSIEIMMNAAGLAFVAGSAIHGSYDGQIFFIFILPVAAAEVAIGLALALLLYQKYKTLDLWVIARSKEE
ncbi:MAG: NADH-quinone oxidoreductase subunit NuoK [Candidatus Sumerlaeaceae bacterium]|nr:NADH-quinone oxidoreductase subunit NuoK [Candidatus Sumerlaeaceae bacterium]